MTRLLYLAPVEWTSIRQRPQQLAVRLARHFDVCYVDPVGLRSARLADLHRIWRSAATPSPSATAPPLIKPRYVPFVAHRMLDEMNRRWLFRQVSRRFDFGGERWILWLTTPSLLAEALLKYGDPGLVVYDCMDRYSAFHHGATRERIDRAEAAIVVQADLVFASSHGLAERLARLREVTLVPNGVETAAFAISRGKIPAWKEHAADVVVGFYGTIGDWLDFELLAELARRRPAWLFVFAGPQASRHFDHLRELPNVQYLGVIPYDELPRHAAWFDVGVIPFRLNALTRYVHPIKALEYLSLGLPVVSAPLPDLAEFSSVIRFASSVDEWRAAIEEALSTSARSPAVIAARRRAAAAHDWENRVATIVGRLTVAMQPAPTLGSPPSFNRQPSAPARLDRRAGSPVKNDAKPPVTTCYRHSLSSTQTVPAPD